MDRCPNCGKESDGYRVCWWCERAHWFDGLERGDRVTVERSGRLLPGTVVVTAPAVYGVGVRAEGVYGTVWFSTPDNANAPMLRLWAGG